MLKKSLLFFSVLSTLFLMGCSGRSDDEDFRTVPVTNNPLIVPEKSNSFPSVSGIK